MALKDEKLDFEKMDEGQLREFMQHAQEELHRRAAKRLEEIRQIAREAGYELIKIGEGEGRRRKRRTREEIEADDRRPRVNPKYRNPRNPHEEWSGRGRKPRWVQRELAEGRGLENLVIPFGAEA